MRIFLIFPIIAVAGLVIYYAWYLPSATPVSKFPKYEDLSPDQEIVELNQPALPTSTPHFPAKATNTSNSVNVGTEMAITEEPEELPVDPQKISFYDSFDSQYMVEETGSLAEKGNANWWLSSGAYFYSENGIGHTVLGALEKSDEWRERYSSSNPTDTDDGYHPQNIFRLVQRGLWSDYEQEVYFKIDDLHFSDSEFRNGSNGLLLFNRYQDEFNLYYVGVRVDGQVTAKKKQYSEYSDLGSVKLLPGVYNRNTNQNLLPVGSWIGLRSRVETLPSGYVSIRVFIDWDRRGNWNEVLAVVDNGRIGGPPITASGHSGIRTDFMDVLFDDYHIQEI